MGGKCSSESTSASYIFSLLTYNFSQIVDCKKDIFSQARYEAPRILRKHETCNIILPQPGEVGPAGIQRSARELLLIACGLWPGKQDDFDSYFVNHFSDLVPVFDFSISKSLYVLASRLVRFYGVTSFCVAISSIQPSLSWEKAFPAHTMSLAAMFVSGHVLIF